MASLGEALDIEQLVRAANDLVVINAHLPHEVLGSREVSHGLYDCLVGVAGRIMRDKQLVTVVTSRYVCAPTEGRSDYRVELSGEAAAIVGKPRGLGFINVRDPFSLGDGETTNVLPALSFDTRQPEEVEVRDTVLSYANLYHRVAVPLLGQEIEMHKVSGIFNVF